MRYVLLGLANPRWSVLAVAFISPSLICASTGPPDGSSSTVSASALAAAPGVGAVLDDGVPNAPFAGVGVADGEVVADVLPQAPSPMVSVPAPRASATRVKLL